MLPEDVNIMALTATASQATCKQVCRTLGMVRPAYIIKTPDKPNIHLSVKQKPDSVEEASQTLPYIDRTGYKNYSNIYKYFDNRLGPEITEPIGVDKVAPVKLVNLYTVHGTKPKVKDAILSSFCSPCGILRVYRCLWHGDGCSSHCSLEASY